MDVRETGSINQERQQKINRTLVLRLLYRQGLCSRADLARLSGLKRATITNIISELIQCGIVKEEGILSGQKGRRSIGIRLNGEKYKVIGIMLRRDSYSIGLFGLNNKIDQIKVFPIGWEEKKQSVIEEMKENIKKAVGQSKGKVLAIGVAVPGPYRQRDGKILFITNMTGFGDVSILQALQKDLDLPIFIENDANTGVIAQRWKYSKEQEVKDIVYVLAGQGIGSGIISEGRLMRGAMGMAGEMGHCSINFQGPVCECGNRGCLELYCSMHVLLESLKKRIISGELTMLKENFSYEDVSNAIRQGDSVAMEEYEKVCRFLAVGIVNIANQINPGMIIIGDELADLNKEKFLRMIKAYAGRLVSSSVLEKVEIKVNELLLNPSLLGAAVMAGQKIFEDPFSFLK